MTLMEGILWKWTNYLSGWQPRYFILEVGVLAYYKSQEEVGMGSRGSIKMSCCEISVHPTDTVRIDLKIPPDQYIYLRAATPAERQQWLVALGTAKACITLGPSSTSSNTSTMDLTQNISQLKEKMEELNTYRSLLMQQINTIKLMCTEKEENQEFTEAATMLSATCDEFLKNLCDCMEIAETSFAGSPPSSPTSSIASLNVSSSKHMAFRKHLLHDSHRSPPTSPTSSIASSSVVSSGSGHSSTSQDREISPVTEYPPQKVTPPKNSSTPSPATSPASVTTAVTRHPTQPPLASSTPQSSKRQNQMEQQNNVSAHSHNKVQAKGQNGVKSLPPGQAEDVQEAGPPTFFSRASTKFEDVKVTAEGGIPTKVFLAACSEVVPFFDVLGPTAFAPVKMDIAGNIKKLTSKFETDQEAFYTLHNIVYQELKSNTCTAKNSATDALLWLKRALEFIQIFLLEVVKGRQDLAAAAGIAYEKSLRRYHGWVVRGVFALAVKAVPYREDFLSALGATEEAVLRDMKCSVTALGLLLQNLNHFYLTHKLDSDLTV